MRMACFIVLSSTLMAQPSGAISVFPTASPGTLEAALLGLVPGLTVTSTTVSGQLGGGGELSTGVYTNGSATYGIAAGVVISTGDVSAYSDGPNFVPDNTTGYFAAATGGQELLLDPITGGPFGHYDVTEIDMTFDADLTVDDIFFNVVFGSEEFNEYVGYGFNDGFGIYLNGVNIALSGGLPINIDHPDMLFLPGTEIDGILAPGGVPLLSFAAPVTPGSTGNLLTFILADTSDDVLDTTVYISGFGSVAVPEPGTLLLLGAGAFALLASGRRVSD